jgi:hypothetical protein
MLAIAITLVAGAAAWGLARNQAAVSENALQSNVGGTNNFLSEQFKVIDMYSSSSTTITFLVYNTGGNTLQLLSTRLYDSAGLMNLRYNYTQSGTVKTDQVYDLRSSASNLCKTAAATYESPSLTTTTTKVTNVQSYTLTVPGTQGGCPSLGQQFNTGTTYTVVVTGIYGNVVTFYQTK